MASSAPKPLRFGLASLFWLMVAVAIGVWVASRHEVIGYLMGFAAVFLVLVVALVAIASFIGHRLADLVEWLDRPKER